MWRSLASNALTLMIVAVIAVGIVIAWGQNQYRAPGPLAEAICVEVPRGGTFSRVSDDLAEKGAIGSPALLRIGADYTDRSGQLKAGSFLIEPGASMEEIVATVTDSGQSTCGSEVNLRIGVTQAEVVVRELDPATGTFVELASFPPGEVPPEAYTANVAEGFGRFRVTLAEGVTSWQVVESLAGAEFLEGAAGDVPAEGTLAPGSYEVAPGSERAALLARMRESQEATLAAAWAGRAGDLPLQSAEEALILASIIEKETAVADERRRISGVFVNRLNQGMRLQTDPTVIYGVTEGRGTLGRGIRASELRRATPYNTYVIEGLPPGPIANPGREAILAAVNPETTNDLFFVADGTGGHAFAETLDEHNANVARWRQIEAEQGTAGTSQ